MRVSPVGPFPYHLPSLLSWVGFWMTPSDVPACSRIAWRSCTTTTGSPAGQARPRLALEVPLVATVHATEAGRHRGWLPTTCPAGPLDRTLAGR